MINLDGVVNPDVLEALRNNELPRYLRERDIRYLIEHDIGEAANFSRIFRDKRFEISRVFDLTQHFTPHGETHTKRTYIWKVKTVESEP